MNDAQVENWRRVLTGIIGPYALIMSRGEIVSFRDRFQARADAEEDKLCTCDQKHHGYTRHMDDSVTCNHCGKKRQS